MLAPKSGHNGAEVIPFDRTVHEVLLRFYQAAHPSRRVENDVAALAVRWLSGEALDAAEARRLDLTSERDADAADNQHVKQVLVALARVARAAGRVFLLCFDQVDNLDEEQVKSLSRFLHDLLDSAGNLLIVTTGVKQTLLDFLQRGVITETSWDRIGQFEVALGRLRRDQGWELLRERLLRFLTPFRGLQEIEAHLRDDPLFPLGTTWFDARLRDLPDFRPRDLLGWACDRWRQLQDDLDSTPHADWLERWGQGPKPPPAPPPEEPQTVLDRAVAERLAESQARCLRDPKAPPVDGDKLLALIDAALKQSRGGAYRLRAYQRHATKSGTRAPFDLTVEQAATPDGPVVRVGVRVLAPEHSRTVTVALERIASDEELPDRVLLITDERQELPLGPKGRELLAELERRGPQVFRHVALPRRQLAELDALQAVIGLARAGDLEVESVSGQRRAVTEDEVIAAYHRTGRYLANPLLRELLGGEATPAPSPLAAVS